MSSLPFWTRATIWTLSPKGAQHFLLAAERDSKEILYFRATMCARFSAGKTQCGASGELAPSASSGSGETRAAHAVMDTSC